jgi:transcriptional regulator with XRE-family HTH domain/mannose-6-phosphate isomerase-like protein (cupin superfamily)
MNPPKTFSKNSTKGASNKRRDGSSHDQPKAAGDGGPASVGQRVRAERERQRIGLRELARRLNVSASLISQIELGRATPSVGTLYAIVNELNISLDELFFEAGSVPSGSATRSQAATVRDDQPPADGDGSISDHDASHPPKQRLEPPHAPPSDHNRATGVPPAPVVRRGSRQAIHLGSGVIWERMTPEREHGVDFLYVVYEVGGASAPEHALIRHGGREYGHLLEGRLAVTVGFETFELLPGDSISFDSTTPHRLFNTSDTPAKAIWFVVGRDDAMINRQGEPETDQ